MRTTKAFDGPASRREVISGIAAEVAKQIRSVRSQAEDADEASESGGRSFRAWLENLVYDASFIRDVNMQLGTDEFNSEFFMDGVTKGENNG